MDYLEIANSPVMWVCCAPGVIIVLFEAIKFMRLSRKAGKDMGIDPEVITRGVRAAAISSIGPSLAIVIGMLALIVCIGAPFAWFRLSFVGSVMYELMAANFAAMGVGTKLGAPDFGPLAFSAALWVMPLGALGWMIVGAALTHKLEFIRLKLAGGKIAFLPVLTSAAMLGVFAKMGSGELIAGGGRTIAFIIGLVCMIAFLRLADAINKKWIKEWSLGFSMLIGMFVAATFF
ncbi:MAG: Uncharacterized protein XD85_0112 [Parcubacteria bacterium 34_609]|nr:MAG: Uncharacterized protein XD85_0112 [Parcubacteria bacterium 34_609]